MKKTFHSFQEYLTHRGKVLSKPPVEGTPDYKGPKPKSPEKGATKGKGWEVPNVGKKGTPAAYKSGTDKAPKKAEKGGFADMGDKGLVYEPGTTGFGGNGSVSKSEQGMPGGSKKKTWPSGSKTEAFLKDTEGMTTSQFAKHVKKGLNEHCGCENKKAPHVVAYSVGAFHPDPIQAIRYVTYLANENVNLRNALVREAKRAGCAASLLEELLTLPESYAALAKLIDSERGNEFSRRLDKAIRENRDELRKKAKLHEEVDEPAHDDDMDLDDIDTDETEEDNDSDLDLDKDDDDADKGDDDLDLDADGDKGGDLDLGGDDDKGGEGGDLNLGGGDDDKGAVGDLDLGGDDKGGGDLDLDGGEGDGPPDDPHAGNTHDGDDEGGDDAPPPPDDAGGDDDDGKINFDGGDDDEEGGDLNLDSDDDEDDDDLDLDDDDDDVNDDHPVNKHLKKKMPWEDDE